MWQAMSFIKSQKLRIFVSFVVLLSFAIIFQNCGATQTVPTRTSIKSKSCLEQLTLTNSEWSNEEEVFIDGFTHNAGTLQKAMEPQISHDQNVIFFNNKTDNDTEMNVHYAIRQSSGRFQYAGTLPGTVNPTVLDGVPAMDALGNFYFMSLRNYGATGPNGSTFRTIFGGKLNLDSSGLFITEVASADTSFGAGKMWDFDMDIGVSWDGTLAVSSRATFAEGKSYPDASYLELFNVNSRNLTAHPDNANIMKNVNLPGCISYAPSLSSDLKELYFTILGQDDSGNFDFRTVVSKRNSISDPFGTPAVILAIPNGYVAEAPSITFDDGGKTLYFHRKDPHAGDRFKIYKISRQ